MAQEIAGRATGDRDMRAKGEVNQVAGHVRSRAGEAARKIGNGRQPREDPRPALVDTDRRPLRTL